MASQGSDTSIDDAVSKGERVEAPNASLPLLGGRGESSLAAYRGKVVVLNFWASWCPPCIDELPLLERTQRRIARRGGTVLGVNYKDIPEDALALSRALPAELSAACATATASTPRTTRPRASPRRS